MSDLSDTDFTAVAMCPKCDRVAVHPFRMPKHRPPDAPEEEDTPEAVDQKIVAWGGETVRVLGMRPIWRWDPDWAEVVRQCECGTEWPQR